MAEIDASPTKDFFISIITKDISLLDAVKDLVDNSVDGARSVRKNGDFKGLAVQLNLSSKSFSISDNCGGMAVSTAAEYAFRFGRAAGAPNVEGSIGQFGVGMKRALFKMGRKFEVSSVSSESSFKLTVDVDAWKRLKDKDGNEIWKLAFDEVNEGQANAPGDCGTVIRVEELHPVISSEFESSIFLKSLIKGIQDAHASSMDAGLDIKVNAFSLSHRAATLLQSDELVPFRTEFIYPADQSRGQSSPVRLSLYAGISSSNIEDAGWSIICNGRQIVTGDKSPTTGWSTVEEEYSTPKAHQQFARFRGYAVFESDDASSLPWNTSKSGVDADSRVYQSARQEMTAALRQVINFLNALAGEKDSEDNFLQKVIDRAKPVEISKLQKSTLFRYPTKPVVYSPKTLRIQFDRSIEDIDFARDFFQVPSAKKAGEAAFDYFLERERD
nr:ATP-binding protein [Stenotrophomonas pavanii]